MRKNKVRAVATYGKLHLAYPLDAGYITGTVTMGIRNITLAYFWPFSNANSGRTRVAQ